MKAKAVKAAMSLTLVLTFALIACAGASAYSGEGVVYENSETGYQAVILDEYDLLTGSEERQLVEYMAPITEFGNIAFWSTDESTYNEIEQAKHKRYKLFGDESSGIFSINMSVRKVTFQTDGRIYDTVTESYARTVTDNVSGYASRGDYFHCAAEAFSQIGELLEGNRIAEPMKYTSYVFIALMLAFVIVVGIAFGKVFNPLLKRNKQQALLNGKGSLIVGTPNIKVTDSYMRMWWQVLIILVTSIGDSSSGGGGGGGHSSGGGGGSYSGGGGGGSSSF